MDDLAKQDYWRATMYRKLREQLAKEQVNGEGVEFGGSNGIIQGMLPGVSWEARLYPEYDITSPTSFDRNWDVIVADQVLEHVKKPWEAMRLIGIHTRQLAVITVPFLIRIHGSPRDYWRMSPSAIQILAQPYFSKIDIHSWGTVKANHWHALYNKTDMLMHKIPEQELVAELYDNHPQHPFVIWAVLKK